MILSYEKVHTEGLFKYCKHMIAASYSIFCLQKKGSNKKKIQFCSHLAQKHSIKFSEGIWSKQ